MGFILNCFSIAAYATRSMTSTSILMFVMVAVLSQRRFSSCTTQTPISACLCWLCRSCSILVLLLVPLPSLEPLVVPLVPLCISCACLLRYFSLPTYGVIISGSVGGSILPLFDFKDSICGPTCRVRFAPGMSCMICQLS